MNITEAFEFIHKTVWLGSKPGLSRTYRLLELLGNPQKELRFVHVAGTNGKGSTCACIASILGKAGLRVGLYTSPYINVFNERMQICGRMISDNELCELCEYIKPFSDSMTDDPPTEFELITALAMEYFKRNRCDIVVLEVGLGGELDSTNVIDPPLAAVICSIGLDHTAILGDTVEKIAAAKAGIIKPGTKVALYDAEEGVHKVFADKCKSVGAELVRADFSKISNIRHELTHLVFDYGKYRDIELGLVGSYQPNNASVAICSIELLRECGVDIPDECIYEGLRCVSWPGRFEILGREPIFILDGAHNPHGMKATVKSLGDHFGNRKIHFVVGAMKDKDVSGMMEMLVPYSASFTTVRPDNPRAMDENELSALLISLGANAESRSSVHDAVLRAMLLAGKNGVVACLGSLYFSGEIRRAYSSLCDKV